MPISISNFDFLQTSIREVQQLLKEGKITSVQLVEAYLNRIERDNQAGMALRAVIATAPRDLVLSIASGLDEERSRGEIRSELHGIPVLVKDNIATDPELGMDTTAGSFALKDSVVPADAFVIARLRKAGAIVIAKTNLNELSGWKGLLKSFPLSNSSSGSGPRYLSMSTNNPDTADTTNNTFRGPTNGWSAVGGQCSSAYVEGGFDNGGNPFGSSSGSAVGLSVGWGVVAVGTDTLGSVNGPASRAALYAVRPTVGRLSRSGVVPISLDHDTVGPMGSTTYDIALMLEVMSGEDVNDRYTHRLDPLSNLTSIASDPPPLSSFTIGIPTRHFLDNPTFKYAGGCPSDCKMKFKEVIQDLHENHGLSIKWDTDMDLDSEDIKEFKDVITGKIDIDFKEDMNIYLKSLKESKVRNVLDLAMFNDKYSERILSALSSPPRNSSEHQDLSSRLGELADDRSLGYIFKTNPEIDAVVFAHELGAPSYWVGAAKYPAGVVPLGYCSNGLPYGMLIVTRKFEEDKLIGIMAAYENVMPKRQVPKPYYDRYGTEGL
uniref:Amidase domain-containing protein n=1 Tax=Kwoniella bestiolae CBS 10118 TaxID=1296100 RepID=A0A1B9GAS5_9TREE|nr:hypothetical protein I302_02967 [Kwoniella bestiolae CBS 10118]OCF28116.1 hypothetical protein I302_02967 [Kwoniella bestiolae CBS 10118]